MINKTPANVLGKATDEQAMEAVAAIEHIAQSAKSEIQRLQIQVQRNLERVRRELATRERSAA